MHKRVCIWWYITYVPKKYITQWRPSVAGDMQQLIGQHKMLSHIFSQTNHKFFFLKITKCKYAKKVWKALIFLMFGKNYPNYRKLAKTKTKLTQTLKPVSKCDKVFFPTKKNDAFLQKIAIFFLRKGNLWRKILFYFFESSNS